MNIEGSNLCIGCMKLLGQTGRCSFCGMKQEDYNPIPRCLLPGTRLADRNYLYWLGQPVADSGGDQRIFSERNGQSGCHLRTWK